MIKRLFGILSLALVGVLLVSVGVLADTFSNYMSISILNNGTTVYASIPVLVSINNAQLYSQGYISSTGLNTNMQEGASSTPYMVDTVNTGIGTSGFATGQKRSYFYRMGNAPPQTSFPVIVGYGGNVTVVDAANLELGNNFTYSTTGYVDTTAGTNKNLIFKQNAFRTYVSPTVSGNITSEITSFANTTETLAPSGVGSETSIPTLVDTSHWQSQLTNDGDTSYVAVTGGSTWYRDLFTTTNISNKGLIIDVKVYIVAKGVAEGTKKARTALKTNGVVYDGSEQALTGSYVAYSTTYATNPQTGVAWTWAEVDEMEIGVSLWVYLGYSRSTQVYAVVDYYPVISVTATGVSSGEHTVTTSANSTHLCLFVDDVLQASTALSGASVSNNANGYVFMQGNSMVYASATTVTINGTQRLWFQPSQMPTGTALPDRSGNGNTGTIVWGTNPPGIEVTIGAITSSTSTTYGSSNGTEVLPQVVIIPDINLYEDTGEKTGLPQYILFKRAADSLEWSSSTLYGFMMIGTAGVMFIAGLVTTSVPIIAAAIGLSLLGMAASTGVIAPIIVMAMVILLIGLIVIIKRG